MTPTEQRHEALVAANARRGEIAAIKRDLRSGHLSLRSVMDDPPHELRRCLLIDVIRWARTASNGRSLAIIGRQALRDNVNLMLPLGDASTRTRAWAAEWGRYLWRPGL